MEIPIAMVQTRDAACLRLTQSGGLVLSAFGLACVLSGAGIAGVTFGWLMPAATLPPWGLGVAGASVFTLAGLALRGARAGHILDKRRQVIVSWWGVSARRPGRIAAAYRPQILQAPGPSRPGASDCGAPDTATATIEGEFSRQEAEYLYAVIAHALTGPADLGPG